MRIPHVCLCFLLLACLLTPATAQRPEQQRMKAKEDIFMNESPRIGDRFPSMTIYVPSGQPFETDSTRGRYTVWTFGCLTCPPSIWNIAGLEAVQRDYGAKGVQFYFIYKSLAHPELVGHYVQPFTMEERLMQSRQAIKQFGTQIPWVVDAMDNRLKHALGDRPNSQFIVDPDGVIVRKRAWSNPDAVREDLASLVGKALTNTRIEDLSLELTESLQPAAPKGVVDLVSRTGMHPIMMQPETSNSGRGFLAKLRAEGDESLMNQGKGRLYLGFHLDPFYGAHWNNLVAPLTIQIDAPEAFVTAERTLTAERLNIPSDTDPREFMLDVQSWPKNTALSISVTYRACVGDECLQLTEKYHLQRVRDENGGGARGKGPGLWTTKEFTSRMLADDSNKDGRLNSMEASGLLVPHFSRIDRNNDQLLDAGELNAVTQWINFHHQPGLIGVDPQPSRK
jgi:hypothetical protein